MGLGHAVVIGGSVAGLTAARALSESFGRVTIVERDELPAGPELRPGVPQARQLHVLLPLGAQVMDELFPGLTGELADLGCPTVDEVLDTPWFGANGWRARRETDVKLIGFRRPLLEHVIRERVRAIDNVEVVHATFTGLLSSEDASRVTGVTMVADGDSERRLEADLVVDASGRGTRTPRMLQQLGYEPPAEQHVRAYYGYASQFVRPRGPLPQGLKGVITMPFPGQTRGGVFFPSENGLYTLCAMGAMRDYPPADQEGFDQFVRDAATPLFAELAAACEPVSDIVSYQHPGNQRRLWEQMERRPRGFIPIGDAVASFNPIYGQGMTVAAVQAAKLRDRIATLGGDLDALPDAFMEDLREVIEFPFSLASNSDANYPGTTLINYEPPPPETAAFFAAADQAATEDPEIARDILHAAGWFEPELLGSPELAAKVEAWIASGREVTNNDPAVVREPVDQTV